MSFACSAHSAESSAKMRSISVFSFAASSRSSLFALTAPMGSIKSVAPEDEISCTSPGIAPLCSALTGTTKRSERMVIIGSCSALAYDGEEIIFCSESRTLALAALILRRIFASSDDALSAISSSPTMEEVIFSSRNRFACRAEKR